MQPVQINSVKQETLKRSVVRRIQLQYPKTSACCLAGLEAHLFTLTANNQIGERRPKHRLALKKGHYLAKDLTIVNAQLLFLYFLAIKCSPSQITRMERSAKSSVSVLTIQSNTPSRTGPGVEMIERKCCVKYKLLERIVFCLCL